MIERFLSHISSSIIAITCLQNDAVCKRLFAKFVELYFSDILYEKQGSKIDGIIEAAKIMFQAGKLTAEEAVSMLHVPEEIVRSWKR